MSDLPIPMSAPMVRACLREIERPGTGKTVTRRVLDPQPIGHVHRYGCAKGAGAIWSTDDNSGRIRYWAGDRLYVREHWRIWRVLDAYAPRELQTGGLNQSRASIWYEATPNEVQSAGPLKHEIGRFRQGMHMPRWASRLTLIVTDVRVERLQDISREDAIAEGIEGSEIDGWRCYLPEPKQQDAWQCPRESFRTLWDSINAERGHGWETNPWVAAYTFRTILGNIDTITTPASAPALADIGE